MWRPKRFLGVSPHADDLELGAGGTVSKWIAEGSEVCHIIFSALGQKEFREKEVYAANKELGIDKSEIAFYDFEHRFFYQRRQQILQLLCDAANLITPDVVLIPSSFDIHQDHEVVHKEALRAFKNITILGYEDPWNMFKADLRLTVRLEEKYIRAKCRAALAHKSQAERDFMNTKFIVGTAMMRGLMIKNELAENFEVIRWVL